MNNLISFYKSAKKQDTYSRFLNYAPILGKGNRLSLGFVASRAIFEGSVLTIIQIAVFVFRDGYYSIRYKRSFNYQGMIKPIQDHYAAIKITIKLFSTLWKASGNDTLDRTQQLPKEYLRQKMGDWLICNSKDTIVFGQEQIDFINKEYLTTIKPHHNDRAYTPCIYASPKKYKYHGFTPLEEKTPLLMRICFVPKEKKEALANRCKQLGLQAPLFIDETLDSETKISFEDFPKMPFFVDGWISGLAHEPSDYFPCISRVEKTSNVSEFNDQITFRVKNIWQIDSNNMESAEAKELQLLISLLDLEIEEEIMPGLIKTFTSTDNCFYSSYGSFYDLRAKTLYPLSIQWLKLHVKFLSLKNPSKDGLVAQ